ncbi:S-adenosylmethionine synthase [bacterium BMS3Abin05]|nr:S-adenosylmethionine synthase [bacterium BMS3Abin05]GBE26303.1 S-adenosylmethionine synthase [bacterium BMS3Bbin03]
MSQTLFTSESVTEGHPDKVADQISDAILDSIIEKDPYGRVACETFVTTGIALIGGEITTDCYVDIPSLVRDVIRDIGYTDAIFGFDGNTCSVLTAIDQQSPDIAMGVDRAGAGDQGMMFGFAIRETPELMPLPIILAHRLTHRLAEARKTGILPYLRPDGKSQVTVAYEGGKPVEVTTIVVSTQHGPDVTHEQIEADVIKHVVLPVIPEEYIKKDKIVYLINPTGRFVQGGPHADTGLTGRKIIVDTYGGYARHGGGAFSGKDPTKVDRSASYAARWISKNIVAAGLADKCEVQLAYAIGVAEPVSIHVDTFGSGKASHEELVKRIRRTFDLTPAGIIDALELRKPIFRKTAAYGHFGRNENGFTWELTNRIKELTR